MKIELMLNLKDYTNNRGEVSYQSLRCELVDNTESFNKILETDDEIIMSLALSDYLSTKKFITVKYFYNQPLIKIINTDNIESVEIKY